jgi:hypothetical protein
MVDLFRQTSQAGLLHRRHEHLRLDTSDRSLYAFSKALLRRGFAKIFQSVTPVNETETKA